LAGSHIMNSSSHLMPVAGVKQPTKEGQRGISDVWNMGSSYDNSQRGLGYGKDHMQTQDINGSNKVNQYG